MAQYTLEDIEKAIRIADEAGRKDDVIALSLRRQGMVSGTPNNVRQTTYADTAQGDISRRAIALGQDPQDYVKQRPADEMSTLQRFGTAMDKGVEDVGMGLKQLSAHIFTPSSSGIVDAEIKDRENAFQSGGLSDYTSGQAGQIAGNVVGSLLPGGIGAKSAALYKGAKPFVSALIEGGVGGASEGMALPTTGDNFVTDKLTNTGLGAVIGGGGGVGVNSAFRGVTGARNLPRRAGNAPNDMLETATRGTAMDGREGVRLAQATGVDLTPGQASGNRSLQFIEQRARESFASAGKVAQGDIIRAGQFRKFIQGVAGDASSPSVGREMQGRVNHFVRDLASKRSAYGRRTYGEIDKLAGGEKVVQPSNVYDELTAIIQEAGTQEGGDLVTAAAQAKKMLETIDNQGGYTAQEALGRLQNYSPYSKGNVFEVTNVGYDAVLKRRVYGALLKDMEETAVNAGDTTIGSMVKEANAGWREFSSQIDGVHKSALGKMVGEEFASDLLSFNTVAPEKVFDDLMKLKPSQVDYVTKFLGDNMPDMLPKLRGGILNDAVDAALMAPPSGGANFMFNPNQFLNALGLKSGKTGVQGMKRLAGLFGGEKSPEWTQMRDIINTAQRMGDAYGKNFSGTSQANSFYAMFQALSGNLMGLAKRVGSTAMEMGGLRKIAQSMEPGSINFGNIQRTQLIQPPRITKPASTVVGLSAFPAVVGADDH